MEMVHLFHTVYGHRLRVKRLLDKDVDGWPMKQYLVSWTEGRGRHRMSVTLDGPLGEMFHWMWLLEKDRRVRGPEVSSE